MAGDIMQAMANAVDQSALILVAVSQGYHDSPNCKRELAYAARKKKHILYYVVDADYVIDGWLAVYMGDSLFVNFQSALKNETAFGAAIGNLVHQMHLALTVSGVGKLPSSAAPAIAATATAAPSTAVTQPPPTDQLALLQAVHQKLEESNTLLRELVDAKNKKCAIQ